MSDNKEKISQDNEIEAKEEAVELEEVLELDEVKVEEDDESKKDDGATKKRSNSFLKRFEAVVIDQIFTGVVAYILLLVFDIAIRFGLGYYVDDMAKMYIIFFVACSIVYPLIIESTKLDNTIGRKFAGLKTVVE